MCNHDFVETNSDPSIPSVIVNVYLLLWHGFRPESRFDLALYYFSVFGGVCAAFTNEFHKWSHLTTVPPWIAMLQRLWIVLPKRHHAAHHKPPFDKVYCITTVSGLASWAANAPVSRPVAGAFELSARRHWLLARARVCHHARHGRQATRGRPAMDGPDLWPCRRQNGVKESNARVL